MKPERWLTKKGSK